LPPKKRLQVKCVQQVEGGPSQPVEPGDDNGIASAHGLEHPHKLRPVAPGAPIYDRLAGSDDPRQNE
jgi:hypothetical protein